VELEFGVFSELNWMVLKCNWTVVITPLMMKNVWVRTYQTHGRVTGLWSKPVGEHTAAPDTLQQLGNVSSTSKDTLKYILLSLELDQCIHTCFSFQLLFESLREIHKEHGKEHQNWVPEPHMFYCLTSRTSNRIICLNMHELRHPKWLPEAISITIQFHWLITS
jgi:hypothetical protein